MRAFDLQSPLQLRDWLANCNSLYELRDHGHGAVWQRIAAGDGQAFQPPADPAASSPKSFFFAEREELYRFVPASGEQPANFIASMPVVESQVLFGVHACDLAAIGYMDRVFADDIQYQARRRSTLLVGFDCASNCSNGFCTLVDSGPAVRPGVADLVLVPMPEGRWVLLSEGCAGDEVVKALNLQTADGDWQARRQQLHQQVASAQGDGQWLHRGIAALEQPAVILPVLRRLAARCFGCSGCSMQCPTCSCFAPHQRASANGAISTERVWDSCLFEGFQREGSGHNPMAAPELRLLRFWQHKFGAAFYAEAGRHGCVGCGRCDRVCPGGIGVRSVLSQGGETCAE